MLKREQLAIELAGRKYEIRGAGETEREEERCLNCIHGVVCEEINKLPCREQFVWYKGETGCPHHLTAVELANAVMLAKTLFPESFGEKKEISCGCKEERIVRMEEKT